MFGRPWICGSLPNILPPPTTPARSWTTSISGLDGTFFTLDLWSCNFLFVIIFEGFQCSLLKTVCSWLTRELTCNPKQPILWMEGRVVGFGTMCQMHIFASVESHVEGATPHKATFSPVYPTHRSNWRKKKRGWKGPTLTM